MRDEISADNCKRIREYFSIELSKAGLLFPDPDYAYNQDLDVLVDHLINRVVNMGNRIAIADEQLKKYNGEYQKLRSELREELRNELIGKIKEELAIEVLKNKTLSEIADLITEN